MYLVDYGFFPPGVAVGADVEIFLRCCHRVIWSRAVIVRLVLLLR